MDGKALHFLGWLVDEKSWERRTGGWDTENRQGSVSDEKEGAERGKDKSRMNIRLKEEGREISLVYSKNKYRLKINFMWFYSTHTVFALIDNPFCFRKTRMHTITSTFCLLSFPLFPFASCFRDIECVCSLGISILWESITSSPCMYSIRVA